MPPSRRRLRSGSDDATDRGQSGERKAEPETTVNHGEDMAKAVSPETQSSSVPLSTKSLNDSRGKNDVLCICKGDDDGRPMVRCEGSCRNWYHFGCVGLTEDTAGELDRYFCPSCVADSGIRSIMDYEGSTAFAQSSVVDRLKHVKSRKRSLTTKSREAKFTTSTSSEESVDDGSEDEYVDNAKVSRKGNGKRVTRRLSSSGESDEDFESEDTRKHGTAKRQKKANQSKPSIRQRQPSTTQVASSSKPRQSSSAPDEVLRHYSLEKLEEIMKSIFAEHGSQSQHGAGDDPQTSGSEQTLLSADDQAIAYAKVLEDCMMEKYAEPDAKTGRLTAQSKYKERLRMFQFNLPKRDRVLLRRDIALGRIAPAQLSVMSSKDLADEQRKHDIEQAEKEALEHSILQKITAPSAKITHKGFEAIEDMSGQRAADSREEEERMEREKREREKQARMKRESVKQRGSPSTPVEPSTLDATFRASNSPLVAQTTSASSVSYRSPSVDIGPSFVRSPIKPLFVPTLPTAPVDVSDTGEGGLRLSDLIDLDSATVNGGTYAAGQDASEATEAAAANNSPSVATPSGPSPFAPAQPPTAASDFDLGSFWNSDMPEHAVIAHPSHSAGLDNNGQSDSKGDGEEGENDGEGEAMDIDEESLEGDHDDALDAILAQTKTSDSFKIDRPELRTLPTVWTGHVAMPTEKLDLLEFKVVTKQIGGQAIKPDSHLWRVLFPSPQTRVDGRVPTGSSGPYLVASRLNPSKELIIVTFLPESEQNREKYDEFFDFFVKKDRHALVFPWGQHPKSGSGAPGRELYIVPLAKDQPLPEFVELMDDHQLPTDRTENVLVGVYVLTKGKLASAAIPPIPTITPLPFHTPSAVPSGSTSHVQSIQAHPTPIPPPATIDQTALAAEVASLTPEQISLMLRHLQQSAPQLASVSPPSVPFQAARAPPDPAQGINWNVPGSQHLLATAPPAAAAPVFIPHGQQYHNQLANPTPESRPSGPYPSVPSSTRTNNEGHVGPQKHFGRDERGRRGRGRPRGSGKGRGRNNFEDTPPADNGWTGRGRGGTSGRY